MMGWNKIRPMRLQRIADNIAAVSNAETYSAICAHLQIKLEKQSKNKKR